MKSLQEFDESRSAAGIPELQNIPDEVVESFRAHLKFAKGGLAHSDYSMLQGYVDDKEIPALFARLGIPRELFDLIEDTSCVSGLCFTHPRAFCNPDRCEG